MQAENQNPASAAEDQQEGEGEDWREVYRRARLDAEREHKRKAAEAERRRQTRRQFWGPRPDTRPDGGNFSFSGGRWGIPGRNPLMAGGDYDRMPNLPAAPVRLSLCLSHLLVVADCFSVVACECDRVAG